MSTRRSGNSNSIVAFVQQTFNSSTIQSKAPNMQPVSYLIGSQKLLEHIDSREDLVQCLQIASNDGLDLALTTLRTLLRDCTSAGECRKMVDVFALSLGAMEANSNQFALIRRLHHG